ARTLVDGAYSIHGVVEGFPVSPLLVLTLSVTPMLAHCPCAPVPVVYPVVPSKELPYAPRTACAYKLQSEVNGHCTWRAKICASSQDTLIGLPCCINPSGCPGTTNMCGSNCTQVFTSATASNLTVGASLAGSGMSKYFNPADLKAESDAH